MFARNRSDVTKGNEPSFIMIIFAIISLYFYLARQPTEDKLYDPTAI